MYTVSYVETRKHHILWINKVFCAWRPTCWWDMFCSALTGWGEHQRGSSYSYVWIVGKKLVLRLAARMKCCVLCSQLSTEGSHNGETCLDKFVYFVHCSDVLWQFSKTPLFKTMSSLGDLVIHSFKICLRYMYSHAPHDDGPHIRRWSH